MPALYAPTAADIVGRAPARPWLWAVLAFLAVALFGPARAVSLDEPVENAAAQLANLDQLERAFQAVVAEVSASVVGIRAQRRYITRLPGASSDPERTFEQLVLVNGSGTILRADGLILTNEHVVQAAHEIEIVFHDGVRKQAVVLAADPRSDLAVLHADRTGLAPVRFCDWDSVRRGQWSLALGNPFGLGADGQLSVSVGVVSNLNRRLPGLGEVDDRLYSDMIQTTAAINPGNSGGPLFNVRGEMIGIVTAMHTRAGGDEGVGFAIPLSPDRRRIIDHLLAGRPIHYGYLGLTVRAPDEGERSIAGIGPDVGALVQEIEPDSPASQADVRAGDVIVRFDKRPVGTSESLAEMVGRSPIGEEVELELRRGPDRLQKRITVVRRDISRVGWLRGGAVLWRGMRLADLDSDARGTMGVEPPATGVVVIDVLANSPAEAAGVRIGDVIEQVGPDAIHSLSEFRRQARTRPAPGRIHIRGRGDVAIPR